MNTPNNIFRNNGTRKGRHAFTLVELLVVVAIIALLVSILLPTLGKAKEQAKIVMCLSNLKGLGLGYGMYAHENDDWYPQSCGAGGGFNPGRCRGPTDDVHRNNDAANYLFCDSHAVMLSADDPNLIEPDDYYFRIEK